METIPNLGLGTWENTDPEACANSVQFALELGYRHIDTAQAYDNEPYVGEGIARADVDRDEFLLATKVHDEFSGLGYDRFYSTSTGRSVATTPTRRSKIRFSHIRQSVTRIFSKDTS